MGSTDSIDLGQLIDRMEMQQKMIGALQVKLQHTEDKAAALDNRVFEMRALLQSGKGFSQILNLSGLLDAFMAVCRERYAAINSAVLLYDDLDPNNIFYRVRGHFGLANSFIGPDQAEEEIFMFKIPHDRGLLWQLIHQGDVFAVRDMRKLPRFETAFKKWNLNVLQSDVWVPLIRGSNVLGVLTLGECEDGSQISETDYSFLEEIAAVAATNIDSTLKYEKNNRILKNLRTLYDVNQQLVNVNDFKQLIGDTLSTAVAALNGQKANLMLQNKETSRLEIKVVHGAIPEATKQAINDGTLETRSFELGEGAAGIAALTRKPVRLNDHTKIEQVGRQPVNCILSVPILYGAEVEGVITITNKVKPGDSAHTVDPLGRFGEEDEQLLMSLADNAAVNLNKARLYNASITDRLTHLYNARHFEIRLAELLDVGQRSGQTLSLAVIDIDHFKRFNDQHGHKAGDLVLSGTAEILRKMTRRDKLDACFRYGGEEFCMIMPDTDVGEAEELMDQFRQQVAAAVHEWEGKSLGCTVSVGVSCNRDFAHQLALFEAADKALYKSKEGGRNRVTRAVVSSDGASS